MFELKKDTNLREMIKKGIFLGYSTKLKRCRIFNLHFEKMVISRDVKFDENASRNREELMVEQKLSSTPQLQISQPT